MGYLCFTAKTSGSTVRLSKIGSPSWTGSYSLDGSTWTTYTPGTTGAITLTNIDDKVYFKGTLTANNTDSKYLQFSMTGEIEASGSIMSMSDGDSYTRTSIIYTHCFKNLFKNCSSLTTAPELPATTLSPYCYDSLFSNCTSLKYPPTLPSTTLATYCYDIMFGGCTSLIKLPELPATTLTDYCYFYMFYGCTGIKLSTSNTGYYTKEFRIPSSGTGTVGNTSLYNMFASTGGTFTGTPSINTTYYVDYYERNGTLKDGDKTLYPKTKAENLLTNVEKLGYSTTAPTAANTDGLKVVVLTSEPATKYDGYLYIITEA